MSDISIAESKIQILYLVDRAPGVSYHLLMEKCMESLYTDFFTFSRSYEELISGNLMDKSSSGAFTGDAVGSTENLTLTDGGKAVLNDLLSSLNAPLRARLDEAANAIISEMGPTRPRYIVAVMISLPRSLRLGVKFRVRPTVAVALTGS